MSLSYPSWVCLIRLEQFYQSNIFRFAIFQTYWRRFPSNVRCGEIQYGYIVLKHFANFFLEIVKITNMGKF